MKKFALIILSYFLALSATEAQNIYGASSRFDDSTREWIIYFSEEGEESEEMGLLEPRWLLNNDDTEWVFRVGELDGYVTQANKPNRNRWTMRAGSELVEIRTIFPDDYNSWRITNNHFSIDIQARDPLMRESWEMRSQHYGSLDVFTVVEGDKRDWEMAYQVDSKVTPLMMMAVLFVTIYSAVFAF